MAENIFKADFIDVSIAVLQRIKGTLPFDIYIQRAQFAYTKLFPKGEALDQNRLKEYEQNKGIRELFVQREDYKEYLYFVDKIAEQFLAQPEKVPADILVQITKEMADLTMLDFASQFEIDQDAILHAARTVQGCIKALAKDPKSLIKIFQLMSRHPYTIKHSIATSIFSLMLAQSIGMDSGKSLETVGLGAFLHDIGMSQISFDAEEKTALSGEDWKEVKEHPQLGKRMLDTIKGISAEVRAIVLQHHEQPNGQGYPNRMRDRDIYPPAKIVGICDSFTALVQKRPYREDAFSPDKALATMKEDIGKFDTRLLSQFESLFKPTKLNT